jgi:hypothetical protein
MLDNYGYIHPIRIWNTYCFSTAAMVTRTPLCVTLYIHCLSFYYSDLLSTTVHRPWQCFECTQKVISERSQSRLDTTMQTAHALACAAKLGFNVRCTLKTYFRLYHAYAKCLTCCGAMYLSCTKATVTLPFSRNGYFFKILLFVYFPS